MGKAAVDGGDELRSGACGNRPEEGEERGKSERAGGGAFRRPEWPEHRGGTQVAWRPRARRALPRLCLLAEVGDDWHGLAVLGRQLGRQVSSR